MAELANKKYVLFSILYWGLGHASRSIPLIRALQSKGYEVVICSEDKVHQFLKRELNSFHYESLPGYNIRYEYRSMALNMLLQSPKIYSAYRREKKVFKHLVQKYNPHFCISDNRYGCCDPAVRCYFLGHQWSILNLKGKVHSLASAVNQYFIKKFDKMIIPDTSEHRYSGLLSKDVAPQFALFSEILSRFTKTEYLVSPIQYDIGIILSGPEPSRTKLETALMKLMSLHPELKVLLIRGTNNELKYDPPINVRVENMVNGVTLSSFMDSCKTIVSRSGYSSIMDYIRLGVNQLIFIPTSGQTEQEYLAKYYLNEYQIPYLEESNVSNLMTIVKESKPRRMEEKGGVGLENLIEQIESELVNR